MIQNEALARIKINRLLVLFLLSEDNGYVNGQTIAIDGGEAVVYGNT